MFRFIAFLLGREYESCKACIALREQITTQQIELEAYRVQESPEVHILREQLAIANAEKDRLFDRLMRLSEPEVIPVDSTTTFVPPRPKRTTWQVKARELEKQDKVEMERLRDIAILEKELELEKEKEEKKDAPESTSTH